MYAVDGTLIEVQRKLQWVFGVQGTYCNTSELLLNYFALADFGRTARLDSPAPLLQLALVLTQLHRITAP